MKKLSLRVLCTLVMLCVAPICAAAEDATTAAALHILHRMSLQEKIGQKLMLDFRYWCPTPSPSNPACTQDFTAMNPTIKTIMSQHHIGGIILFSNNLKDITQITTLTYAFQQVMADTKNLPVLIGTDQEGGIVGRLPRDQSVIFPGNMATAAADLGRPDQAYGALVGKAIAKDLKAVGINIDFAPDVDVNVNPRNPVIHVRSFSDDPKLVAKLGSQFVTAIQSESVAATLKHFPGHGDTMTDSHLGLPLVEHTLAEAWAIDLYPFKAIIEKNAPDLIMTAHIQYPALDDSLIEASKAGKKIIAPATLSRKIQYDLLRKQLNYAGVVITDALDMGAIAENFDSVDATIKAFQAGDDIALMPVAMTEPADIDKISALISKIVAAVSTGEISQKELDASVLRILKLKIKLGLLKPDQTPLADKISNATATLSDENQHKLESAVTDAAVTLVQNKTDLLPIKLLPGARIHILTPWLEQGAGIAVEIRRLQAEHLLPSVLQISFAKMADTNLITEKLAIDNADIIIVGDSATKSLPLSDSKNLQLLAKPTAPSGTLVFPDMLKGDSENSCNASLILRANSNLSDAQFAYEALLYAKDHGKKTIFMSLLAPYDLPNYKDAADVMLAGYDWYGYLTDSNNHGFYRGPSMPALTRILFGISKAQGRLPIQIPNPNNLNEIVYPRGYGM